jgi:hypothetical protein
MSKHSISTVQLEPPIEAPIQSAGELLVQALNSFEKISTELQEFKGCIALAEADESSALEATRFLKPKLCIELRKPRR